MPTEFTAVLVKGRRNYLSLRRMKNALGRAAGLFSEEEEYEQLRQIEAWSRDTTATARSPISPTSRRPRCGKKWPATAPTAWAASAPPTPPVSIIRPGGG